MKTVPVDILKSAVDLCGKAGQPALDGPFSPSETCMIIILSIMGERDRCARIVETWGQDHNTISPSYLQMAHAIRGEQ